MTKFSQRVFGQTPDGQDIIIYTLTNGKGSQIEISTFGAAIVSVRVPDHNGAMADVCLGYKDAATYIHDDAASGKTVGRVTNRIANGRMTIDGKEYQLETNNGPNHLHGGTDGWGNRNWTGKVDGERLFLTLKSDDGDQGYPGEVNAEAIYTFDDNNNLEIEYNATTNKTTPVNMTNHIYFNLSGDGSGTILDHELRLNCAKVLEMNSNQIPTGKLLDTAGTVMDFKNYRAFGPGLHDNFNYLRACRGYDHPFVVDNWKPGKLCDVGELRDPRTGRKVTVKSTQPSVMVYTGNWLGGKDAVAKSGAPYIDYAGVALECQGFPDAVNHPEFPSVVLHPGEKYHHRIIYTFGCC
eukprot:Blabericola_migrator_1__5580@NODE_283_length_10404_cov_699_850924_g233_i0_p3_GENE_NODE_283_length_10404_cov_699_850924_g233_i0NODE_283_length_10404_cov_699_850924_g233_i0_p3_ORF_typecomplete_len352_score39_09Aldose_epim/PF01263_20/8_9e94DUF1579/PF07617_11/0_64DUF1579/PF07617_11/3_1e02_NODE_283_length_10404_cov_699_850924_g233_i039665021